MTIGKRLTNKKYLEVIVDYIYSPVFEAIAIFS